MARLDEKEMKVLAILRKMPTGKLTVVKYGGEIKHIETQVDELIAARAERERPTEQNLIFTKEGLKYP